MADGFVLNISETMLQRLEEADKKIAQIAKTSSKTKSVFNSNFEKMTTSVNHLVKGLGEANKKLDAFGNSDRLVKLSEKLEAVYRIMKTGNKIEPVNLKAVDLSEDSLESLSEKIKVLKRMLAQNREGVVNDTQIDNAKKLFAEIQRLQVAYAKMNVEKKAYDSYQKAINLSENTNSQRANKLMRLNEAYQKLSKSSRDYTKELEELAQAQERLKSSGSTLTSKQFSELSKKAKTLNELRSVAERIKKTMDNVDPKSAEWKKLNVVQKQVNARIDEINKSMKILQKSTTSFGSTLDRMLMRMAAAFSIYQVVNYVNKLVEVRGEFELQNRALEAILQNKSEANKLWNQTLQLAVKSPFQIKELVTYTKQLAAYRIETEKLHDTTKRLADISAGIGVDMSRLVLAYGQVKAANYLRGTELRQFSEAGINILGELSKYFTELEGRFISVGEVFEMVSNRMVNFGDVEEVFKRLTNEGGIFYKMQEKQAETLKGKISNLNDSISIMFNTIGKEQSGVINKSVDLVKTLVENWREVSFYVEKVIKAFAAYKIVTSLYLVGIRNSKKETLLFSQALANLGKSLLMTLKGFAIASVKVIPVALIAFLGEFIRKSTEAERALKALRKQLDGISSENLSNYNTQVGIFVRLVEKLKDVNKGSLEHKEIISQLNSQYGDYLGYIVTEKTTYDELAKSIDGVTTSLRRRAMSSSLEASLGEIYSSTTPKIQQAEKSIIELMKKGVVRFQDYFPTTEQIDEIMLKIEEKTREVGRVLEPSEIEEILKNVTKQEAFIFDLHNKADDFYDAVQKHGENILLQKNEEVRVEEELNRIFKDRTKISEKNEELNKIEEERNKKLKEADRKWEREKINREYDEKKIRKQGEIEGASEEVIQKRINELKTVGATIEDINSKIIDKIGETVDGSTVLEEKFADRIYIDFAESEKGIGQIAKDTAESYKVQLDIIEQQNKLKAVGTVYDQDTIDHATQMAAALKYRLYLLGRLDLLEKKGEKDSELQLYKKQLNALKDAYRTYTDYKNQHFGADFSKTKTANTFSPLFSELGIGKYTEGMDFNEEGIIKVMNRLPVLAGEKGRIAFEQFMTNFVGEIGVVKHDNEIRSLFDNFSAMFEKYDFSNTLKGIGLTPELAKQFFGFDFVGLSDLKKAVSSVDTSNFGESQLREYKTFLSKVEDMEIKSYIERAKVYTKYLADSQNDRVKLKIEELKKLKELDESPEYTAKQKDIIRNRIQGETDKEIQSLQWNEFKKSGMYQIMFKDVESLGNDAIAELSRQLKILKGSLTDLPADEFKEIVSQIDKLEDELARRNPFKELHKDILKLKNLPSESDLLETLSMTQSKISEAQSMIDVIDQYDYAEKNGSVGSLTPDTLREYEKILFLANEQGVAVSEIRKQQEDIVIESKKANDEARNGIEIYSDYKKSLKATYDYWSELGNKINSIFSSSQELMSALGVEEGSVADITTDLVSSLTQSVLSAIQLSVQFKLLGVAANSALGIIGWIATAIQAIASLLSTIFSARDKALVRQIDGMKKKVDRLSESYQKLKKSIDNAWSIDKMQIYYSQMKRNLREQISAQEKALSAAEQRKGANKEGSDAQKEVESLRKGLNEMKEALSGLSDEVTDMLTEVLSDLKGASLEWVDAWYDAFKETGDGLLGLEKNLDAFMLKIVKKQASMVIVGSFLEKWKKTLKEYINPDLNDFEMTPEEAAKYAQKVKEDLPELSRLLDEYFRAFGGTIDVAKGSLSGLQKGIQGITEDTAEIIAAYLNSLRFKVSDTNEKMGKILNMLTDRDENENPILGQLRIISENTKNIYNLLDSLTISGHSRGGRGLKVII